MSRDAPKQQHSTQERPSSRAQSPTAVRGELRKFEPVPDVLVLAAIERAERHRRGENAGVPRSSIAEHLGFVHRSWTTRRLRPQVESLTTTKLLLRSRRHGIVIWSLTRDGRRRLAAAVKAGEVGELWESPQHRHWRHARAIAGERIEGFREEVRGVLDEAAGVLDAANPHSDAWFELAERLQRSCWQLGSATHCLYEWPEPYDVEADVDDYSEPGDETLNRNERGRLRHLRTGRRGTWRWSASGLHG
jgi:hypothetical protein